MTSDECPPVKHFHVVFEQVGSFKRPSKAVIASEPNEALAMFIPELPVGWRGGVSVYDDTLGHEDEMPLAHQYIWTRNQIKSLKATCPIRCCGTRDYF